jgi:hypothetical protein
VDFHADKYALPHDRRRLGITTVKEIASNPIMATAPFRFHLKPRIRFYARDLTLLPKSTKSGLAHAAVGWMVAGRLLRQINAALPAIES